VIGKIAAFRQEVIGDYGMDSGRKGFDAGRADDVGRGRPSNDFNAYSATMLRKIFPVQMKRIDGITSRIMV